MSLLWGPLSHSNLVQLPFGGRRSRKNLLYYVWLQNLRHIAHHSMMPLTFESNLSLSGS